MVCASLLVQSVLGQSLFVLCTIIVGANHCLCNRCLCNLWLCNLCLCNLSLCNLCLLFPQLLPQMNEDLGGEKMRPKKEVEQHMLLQRSVAMCVPHHSPNVVQIAAQIPFQNAAPNDPPIVAHGVVPYVAKFCPKVSCPKLCFV